MSLSRGNSLVQKSRVTLCVIDPCGPWSSLSPELAHSESFMHWAAILLKCILYYTNLVRLKAVKVKASSKMDQVHSVLYLL
ncbi:hypothetical protein H5410_059738 [Solanum commersonii]|uniref:Uncharacterized protein n=1 Tax=Solanum commersonii TaxID=4109 RepID=A0A9J5W3V7_SOLCO|nr:hypothetical protein H5410_059738 [Solanum commersonii]